MKWPVLTTSSIGSGCWNAERGPVTGEPVAVVGLREPGEPAA